MNALERDARRFRQEADLRKRAYRARKTSEGAWTRALVALGRAGPSGVHRISAPARPADRIARFERIGGGRIEILVDWERPKGARRSAPGKVLRALRGIPPVRGGAYVCVVPPIDEAAERASDAARLLGRRGGRSRSRRKAAASRENGRKGGRPRGGMPAK